MDKLLTLKGALSIVENCANVREDEDVFIATDFETESCAKLLAEAVYIVNANPSIGVMVPRELDGQEPVPSLAAAMKEVDVVLTPVSKSLAHTAATSQAAANGARILSLTALSEELIASGAFTADFRKQRPLCEKIADFFSNGREVSITTPAGTDLIVSIEGRKGNAHSCIIEKPGDFSGAPNIEANFSPVEGTMEGIFVSDATIPYLGIGKLSRPVTFTIEKGMVVNTEGGQEAEVIKNIWEAQNDKNVYNIAQVAIGLNPEIKAPIGSLGCNYDEGAYGTAHIGIGSSSNLGGKIKTSTHFDALMTKPTIKIDGTTILENGEILV